MWLVATVPDSTALENNQVIKFLKIQEASIITTNFNVTLRLTINKQESLG